MSVVSRKFILPVLFPVVSTLILFYVSIYDYVDSIGVISKNFWPAEIFILGAFLILFFNSGIIRLSIGIICLLMLTIFVRYLFIQFDDQWLNLSIDHFEPNFKSCSKKALSTNPIGPTRCLYFSTFDGEWGRAVYFDPNNACFPKSPEELQRIDATQHKLGEGFIANSNSIYVKKIESNYCLLQFSQQQSQDLPPDFRSIM